MSGDVDLAGLAYERGASPVVRTRRHVLTRYVLPLLLLAGFLALVAWASRDLLFPPREVTVVPVLSTTAAVRDAGTPLFQAAGWIEPRPTPIRVAALAPGVVEQLLVVEDQPLSQGEPVAELVKEDARLALQGAQADLQLRQAEVDQAAAARTAAVTRHKQPVHLEAALSEAEAALARIDTQLQNLPFEARRAQADYVALKQDYDGKLAAQGVVAGVRIDVARSKAESAGALVDELRDRAEALRREQDALRKRRDALRTQLELLAEETKDKEEADAQLEAARARLAQAEVAAAEAQLRLDRMTIVAPVDGRVFQLIAHPGARVGGGTSQMTGHDGSTVVTMYRPDMLQVRVDVRFEDLPQVSLGQPVEIRNPALAAPLSGRVLLISSEADIQKNTLQVKVEIPDPPSVLKPEMLVDATFLAPQRPDRPAEAAAEVKLYVLRQLVRTDERGTYVWVADLSDGVARRTSVQTGAAGPGGLVEVVSGLAVGSRLITSNLDQLRDGDRIRVTQEDPLLGVDAGEGRPTMNRLPKGGRDAAD